MCNPIGAVGEDLAHIEPLLSASTSLVSTSVWREMTTDVSRPETFGQVVSHETMQP